MLFSILLLLLVVYISFRAAPRERSEDVHVHGAGQIGLAAAVALFGVDYVTSYFYATGELMGALHPYGLQQYGYIAVAVIALANFVFGALYMYSLGIFNEGGGSYTVAMRYLSPGLSLVVEYRPAVNLNHIALTTLQILLEPYLGGQPIMKRPAGSWVCAALQALRNNPRVEYVEVDARRYPLGQSTPYGIWRPNPRE